MTRNYQMAYTEVLEIVKHLSPDEKEKIPKETIDFFEKNKDTKYKFTYDVNETLKNQNVLRETNLIIVKLFNDYFATDVQKEKLNRLLNINEDKHQDELAKKYNPENIFKNKEINNSEIKNDEVALAKIDTNVDSIFRKFINKIKKIFIK